MRTALTIAGSDSSGGAGVQADLSTFAAHGVFGLSAITAVTAQNSLGIAAWQAIPADLVTAQIEAVAQDPGVGAVKTGMLPNAAIVEAVAAAVVELDLPNLVVDPVMASTSGNRLADDEALAAMRTELLKRAEVVTPNIPEAEALTGQPIRSVNDMRTAARRIASFGARVVVVKGGHLDGDEVVDVVCTVDREFELHGPRVQTRHTHGTGCTFAAAIAARLARGDAVEEAVREARRYLEGAIRHAPGLGRGHGPLGHFWAGILK
ncbi:MAG: bifunctional hydroxymethylpyrimidine kinase/phosphomethylpyrimidine kinase [Vicinamibacterales bacterium]